MARVLGRDSLTDDPHVVTHEAGLVLDGRFELLELVGSGGMGAVYRARDLATDNVVALKLLTLSASTGLRRFRREYRAASSLDHPNVVAVHSYHAGSRPFFTMEFVPGATLEKWVGRGSSPRSPGGTVARAERNERIRSAISQILTALQYIHERDLVHRDLKPENVLVTPDGLIKIMDFGVVRGGASSSGITHDRIVGTLAYMAPEQLEGRMVDGRTDLYSVGAILYELLTGEAPFDEGAFGSLARAILNDMPPAPTSLDPSADPALANFAMTLLAKKPWQRFASAGDALHVLTLKTAAVSSGRTALTLLNPQFVGRDRELGELREMLGLLECGRGGLLLVGGAPGIGKSAFLEEATAVARRFRILALETLGGTEGADGLSALTPVLTALADESVDGRRLRETIDEFLDDRSEEHIDHLKRAFVTAIATHSARRGLVLRLDDLDRFDRLSFDLVALLVQEMAAPSLPDQPIPKVLILASHAESCLNRTTRLGKLGDVATNLRLGLKVGLDCLSREESEAMLRSMLGETSVPAALVDWLFGETEGNPFFVVETMRLLIDTDVLVIEAGHLTLNWEKLALTPKPEPEASDFATLPMARGIRELLEASLERLPSEVRELLVLAAVAGPEFDFDTLLGATEMSEDELVDALQSAIANRLVFEVLDALDVYRFVHDKARTVLTAHLADAERRPLHARIAAAIESGPRSLRNPISLARNYDAAGDALKASEYLPLAAERLSEATEHSRAVDAWARFIELDQASPDEIHQARVRLGDALARVHRLGEARNVFATVLEGQVDPLDRASTLLRLADLERRLALFGSSIARSCEAMALARGAGSESAEAHALTSLGRAQMAQGHYGEAERSLGEAEELYLALPSRGAALAQVICTRGVVVAHQGRFAEAISLVQTALATARTVGVTSGEQFAALELGQIHFMQGRLARSLDCFEEAVELARKVGRPDRIAQVEIHLARALCLAGDYDAAHRRVDRSLRFVADGGRGELASEALLLRAMVRRVAGELTRAGCDLKAALDAAGSLRHPQFLVRHALEEARLEAANRHLTAARRAARRGLATARGNHLLWHEASARAVLATVLRGPAARRQARRAAELARTLGAELVLAEALAVEATCMQLLGDAGAGSSRRVESREILERAAAELGRRGRLFMRTTLVQSVAEPPAADPRDR